MVSSDPQKIVDPGGGANQSGVRAHNERLVLTLVRRHGSLPKSEIARRSGLSAQAVSVIMRALEEDGLLLRGEPQRGKVGQPSIPMRLNPDGVFSIGLKMGRRSADLTLVDFIGTERMSLNRTYPHPMPDPLLKFVEKGIKTMRDSLSANQRSRMAGIGLSMPFELWNWADIVNAPAGEMDAWRNYDLRAELETLSGLPSFLQNDATAACGAELVFGHGAELENFLYFFVGTFIGGGVVLNHSVYAGKSGNAGAIGPMRVTDRNGNSSSLLNHTSVFTLETMLEEAGIDPTPIWKNPDNWGSFGEVLDSWIAETAHYLASAIVSSCSVIDFEAVVIDGAFPEDVKTRLVSSTSSELASTDLQGLTEPRLYAGKVGPGARALGGASLPLFSRYLLDQNILFRGTD